MQSAPFLFTTCQAGAEATLKQEMARLAPDLRSAYQRPGFVTFKRADGEPIRSDVTLQSIFARTYGLSLGKSPADPAKVLEYARGLERMGKLRLHFYERDRFEPGKGPASYEPGILSNDLRTVVFNLTRNPLFHHDPVAAPGDGVLSVVVVEPAEWWVGFHVHSASHSKHPGARPELPFPAEAPSRAYLKFLDGAIWTGAPLRPGDTAVEIGSAPGGCSYGLLEKGLRVTGIDPRPMAPSVAGNPRFKHLICPVAKVTRGLLPKTVQWLLMDTNVAPNISIYSADRLAALLKDSLLGMMLTIKLTDWKFASEIPSFIEQVRSMGMERAGARQLATSGREFLLYGFSKAGLARLEAENGH